MEQQKNHLQKLPANGLQVNYIEKVQQAAFQTKIPFMKTGDIEKQLLIVMALLGFRPENFPDDNEKKILIEYMRANMPTYSLADMGIAFTLYIQSKLDYNENHFGKFSVLFLEKVMQSYKRYKVALPNKIVEPKQIELSEQERETLNLTNALQCFQRYYDNEILVDWGNVNYDYLDRRGLINLTDERKWEIWKKAKNNLKSAAGIKTMTQKTSRKLSEIIQSIDHKDEGVKAEAKRIALREYFDFLIQTEQQLKDIIA